MAKFKALVTMTLNCEVIVEAKNAPEAENSVRAMEPPDLLEHVVREEIEIDAIGRAKKSD